MKDFKLQAKLALGVGCLVALCDSCDKADGFVPHADVPFTMKVTETRQSHEFVWFYEGEGLECKEQQHQELWITRWNDCILEAFSEDPLFDGVNFSSSDPGRVGIEMIDSASCRLVFVADSAEGVVISASTNNIRHSFRVYSKELIELESVHVTLGERDFLLPVKDHEYSDLIRFEPAIKDVYSHPTGGELFTVIDLVPENASFRKVIAFGSTRFLDINPVLNQPYGEWPTAVDERNIDWTKVKGRQFWYSPDAETYLIRLEFQGYGPDRLGRVREKKLYASLWGRYRYSAEE